MSGATCSQFHPRRLLLFLSSSQVTDEQVIAASEVGTRTPHHPYSIAAWVFFHLVLDEKVCIWFSTNIYGRVLHKKMGKVWSIYCRLCLNWNRRRLLSSLRNCSCISRGPPSRQVSFLSTPQDQWIHHLPRETVGRVESGRSAESGMGGTGEPL